MINNLLLTIAGVDAKKLQNAPKSERIIFPALGLLMCLASLWTGFGMSMKMQSGFDLNIFATGLVFIFAAGFALLLEMIVVGTLKSDSKFLGNLGVRMLLGFNLMILQVVPMLTVIFAPTIEVHKNEQILAKTIQANEQALKLKNVNELVVNSNNALAKLEQAKQIYANPPESNKLIAMREQLETKKENINKINDEILVVERNSNANQKKISTLTDSKEDQEAKKRIEKIIKRNNVRVGELNEEIKVLNTEIDDFKIKMEEVQNEYVAFLKQQVDESAKLAEENNKIVSKAKEEVSEITNKTKELAQAESLSRFFNDISSLIDIMAKNMAVLITSLFIVFIALLIDLMPILTKLQLTKGVYAKFINDEEEIAKAKSDMEKNQAIGEIESKNLEFREKKVSNESRLFELENQQAEIVEKRNNIKNQLKESNSISTEEKDKLQKELIELANKNKEIEKEKIENFINVNQPTQDVISNSIEENGMQAILNELGIQDKSEISIDEVEVKYLKSLQKNKK